MLLLEAHTWSNFLYVSLSELKITVASNNDVAWTHTGLSLGDKTSFIFLSLFHRGYIYIYIYIVGTVIIIIMFTLL